MLKSKWQKCKDIIYEPVRWTDVTRIKMEQNFILFPFHFFVNPTDP